MPVAVENPCVARAAERGSTPRTRALADRALRASYGRFAEAAALRGLCPSAPAGTPRILADAAAFAWVHPRMTPVIRPGELIVGAPLRAEDGPPGGSWLPDGHDWYVEHFARNTPPGRPDLTAMAARGLLSPQGSLNHKVVDYAGFIRTGARALITRARQMAEERTGAERDFCLAFATGHEAIIAHAATYADAAERMAGDEPDPARAAELREIARICRKVPADPAETLHEALQSLWFAYMAAGDATGRVDVYLRDCWEADLAAGCLAPGEAQELLECFLIKLHGDVAEGVVNVSSIQTMTLGGLMPDGSDATSDLTRLWLHAIRAVRLLRPTVYIRCHDATPPDVIDLGVAMLGEGLAEPSFYGDRPIVEGLVRVGVPVEQARDYALSGCTEVVSPGRGNWGAPNGWINLALLADDAIRACAARGEAGPDAIWAEYERRCEELAEACRICNIHVDAEVADTRFTATLLMPVCLDRCRDLAHGGAETHYAHWEAIGLPNAADMLHAALQAPDAEALRGDLAAIAAGDPAATARLRRLPKYGNGCAEVDAVAARVIVKMADALERRSTPLRTALVMGHLAGGENMHIPYGRLMGATLDGRRAGQTLADSLAASQGQAVAGPTALIQSLCAIDHSRLIAGNVSTLRMSPADFATPGARDRVAALVRAFVAMGGSQLQINVADTATLRAAQADPEAHRGLLVRVAGYSADFTSIGRSLQDEIIARLEGLS